MIEFIVTYWLEALFTLVCSIFAILFKYIIKKLKRQQAVEAGLQALLRNELIRRYREYEEKGEISILDKENMEHMFKEYENLDGNGTVAQLYKEILNLPIKIVK
jgi:hypothetical protein